MGMIVRILLLVVLILMGGIIQASSQTKLFWGEGNALCGEWTKERGANTNKGATLGAWFRGFISGANVMQNYMNNIFDNDGASMAAMDKWMSDYCVGHSSDKLIVGADLLVKAIITQNKKP